MPFPLQQFIGLFFAVAAGLICYRQLNKAFRIVALHALLAFVVELSGYAWHLDATRGSNQWMYNLYMIADCALILVAAYYFLRPHIAVSVLISAFVLFMLFWLGHIYQSGSINRFAVSAFVLDSVLALCLYLYLLYKDALSYKGTLIAMPTLWLCMGIVVNYGCNIPYFSTLNAQKEFCTLEHRVLLHDLIMFINHVRYIFVAIAISLYYFQQRKNKQRLPKW